uniref:phage tail protein n=1 Tax=Halomonas sp. TaxID=1486246 RepID=UPI0026191DAD|nr:phage tail protein [Halomonas sp.]
MIKLQSLRKHLLASIPALRKDPDRLLTFIERGAIQFARGQHLSHQYRVPARIVITELGGSIDVVMIPLLQWLSHYQPDLDANEAVRFDAELLANDRWDLAIEVTLTERVVAKVNCDEGKIESEHRMPEFPIDACPAKHWTLYVKAPGETQHQLISEWDSPNG